MGRRDGDDLADKTIRPRPVIAPPLRGPREARLTPPTRKKVPIIKKDMKPK